MKARTWTLTLVMALTVALLASMFIGVTATDAANDQAKLSKLIPPALEGTCTRLTPAAVSNVVPPAAAGVTCLDSGGPVKVDDVGLFLFPNKASLRRFWNQRTKDTASATGIPLTSGDCNKNRQGIEPTAGGEMLCYQQSGEARVRWADFDTLVYGALYTTWPRIAWAYDWWNKNIAPAKAEPEPEEAPPAAGTDAGTVAPTDTSTKPAARPQLLPARLPWATGTSHELLGAYDGDNHDGFGLTFAGELGDAVHPLYPGTVVHAGCGTGESASLGRSVVVRTEVGGHTYDAVYGHLDPADPLPSGAVGTEDVIGHFGSSVTSGTDCASSDGGRDRLYVGLLQDAEVTTSGELIGGRPVYPEPFTGEGIYEGFTWWDGPATAIDLDPGTGEPTGRWAKSSVKDGKDIAYGDKVKLVAKVKDSVPIREVRFTAYYPEWARPKAAARLTGFDPKRTWRILAVCRAPGVGGEPARTKGCKWEGSDTNATVTYTWDPTAAVTDKAAPWQPIARTAISAQSESCVPVGLSFDVHDAAGYRATDPAGAKRYERCRNKATDDAGVVIDLKPLQPPAAPAGVHVWCKKPHGGDTEIGTFLPCFDGSQRTLRWQDRSSDEHGFRIYARWTGYDYVNNPCSPRPRNKDRFTPWRLVGTAPAGSEAWRAEWASIGPVAGVPDFDELGSVELGVRAFNAAGDSEFGAHMDWFPNEWGGRSKYEAYFHPGEWIYERSVGAQCP